MLLMELELLRELELLDSLELEDRLLEELELELRELALEDAEELVAVSIRVRSSQASGGTCIELELALDPEELELL